MTRKWIISSLAAAGLLAAGCSSSGGSNYGAGGNSSSGTPGGQTISMQGGHLVAASGKALYTNSVDTASSFGCSGGCLTEWPPVLGTPTAGSGVTQTALGTEARPDGTMQVTYNGKPLYWFADDKSAGDTKGSGLSEDGITWTLAGAATPGTPAPSTSSSSSSGYGGGGY
jgi:predicted lipoprotein with Yx(FWY)xxD motif